MRTTIAVAVTFKVEAEGETVDDVIKDALNWAMAVSDHGAELVSGMTVEGATALVNREALEAAI